MERLYGVPLTDLDAVRSVTQVRESGSPSAPQHVKAPCSSKRPPGNGDLLQGKGTPEETLIAALNTWFGSVIGAETFHADVHAGNLLVLSDGRVGFIDFGIVGRIKPVRMPPPPPPP